MHSYNVCLGRKLSCIDRSLIHSCTLRLRSTLSAMTVLPSRIQNHPNMYWLVDVLNVSSTVEKNVEIETFIALCQRFLCFSSRAWPALHIVSKVSMQNRLFPCCMIARTTQRLEIKLSATADHTFTDTRTQTGYGRCAAGPLLSLHALLAFWERND